MSGLTLLRQGSELADAAQQVRRLAAAEVVPPFDEQLRLHALGDLQADTPSILQINVGKLCNQTCSHCHVDAGPDRRELMTQETMQLCLQALQQPCFETLDITGGAPEMNPHFRWLVQAARRLGKHVIDRCNLTILMANGYRDLPEFLAEQQVEIVASLPCYLEENTDQQRGQGVFRRSIEGLQRLNEVGYGAPDSGLELTLVFNPVGAQLPGNQQQLEDAYRRELSSRYGIVFTRLITITNLPISRFLDDLLQQGQLDAYLELLANAFNPATVSGLMCRQTLSVDWRGYLYDCDFNQMLHLPTHDSAPQHIRDFLMERLQGRPIVTGRHCYGCTAGAGSGCGGAIVPGA